MSAMSVRRFVRGGLLLLSVLVFPATAAAVVLITRAHAAHTPVRAWIAQARGVTCPSPALGGHLPALVYTPPGYPVRGRRYPVVYFLHGLPATPQSYTQNAFVAEALNAVHEPAIVVAPQGARTAGSDREYLDWSPTENWPRAISYDLTRCIDGRYQTLATRKGRALIGLSAGGYGAFNIGLRNLKTFAAVESWSGYFVATDPSGYHTLTFPTPAAQRAAQVPDGPGLAGALKYYPSLLGFYVGNADDRFADVNQAFDTTLSKNRVPHVFRVYPGGHSGALWRAEAPAWLTMALTYLQSGRTVAPR